MRLTGYQREAAKIVCAGSGQPGKSGAPTEITNWPRVNCSVCGKLVGVMLIKGSGSYLTARRSTLATRHTAASA